MPALNEFYNQMLQSLKACELTDGVLYRQRFAKCRSRTNFMLGNAGDRASGIICQALLHLLPDAVFSHERYIDLAAFSGDWWQGECITLLALEHENNISEIRGTISDLLRYQALQKVAVFYDDTTHKEAALEGQVQGVFEHYNQKGLCESGNTEYLVVFGPAGINDPGIGKWRAMHFTNDSRHRIKWL